MCKRLLWGPWLLLIYPCTLPSQGGGFLAPEETWGGAAGPGLLLRAIPGVPRGGGWRRFSFQKRRCCLQSSLLRCEEMLISRRLGT